MSSPNSGITRLTVAGFKSIDQSTSMEIRPLTILAGPNSSGKTSIMQPLLLLKQTLNAAYDPGPLMLNGPNVKFTAADQLLSNIGGKHLVVETHSSLLLRAVQALVAEGKLPPDLVKLHWFTQQKGGATCMVSADLDENGAFGDWPEDFADVTLDSESRYLDAAQARLFGGKK